MLYSNAFNTNPSEPWKHCLAATVEAWPLAILHWDTDKLVLSPVVNKLLVVVNTTVVAAWRGNIQGGASPAGANRLS